MNEKPIRENVESLREKIAAYRIECDRWWGYNHAMSVMLLLLSGSASAGATIAGAWGCSKWAATLAACGGLIIGFQNGLKYADKAHFYGRALTECDRLTDKLSFQTVTPADFDGVLGAYHQLRNQEDQGSSKKGK